VDIDPKAEDIARENAAYNHFGAPEFTALTGNVTADKKLMARLSAEEYDLILVNIVADVIIGLSPVLPGLMQENTTLLLSGILDVRLDDVKNALKDPGIMGEIESGSKVYYIDGGHEDIDKLNSTGLIYHEIPFNHTLKNNTFKIYKIDV
jgi:hypothetical protein